MRSAIDVGSVFSCSIAASCRRLMRSISAVANCGF
jgi:hypothetical protein